MGLLTRSLIQIKLQLNLRLMYEGLTGAQPRGFAAGQSRAIAVSLLAPEINADVLLLLHCCESACNKDPVFGVIGIQSGPPGRRVHSGFRGDAGARLGMLVVETIAKIRRAYFVQKTPIKVICREFRVSRKALST